MSTRTPPANLWTFTAEDRAVARTLAARLPEQLFDAHAHLYEPGHISPSHALIESGPASAGADVWRRCLGQQLGATRLKHALCVPVSFSWRAIRLRPTVLC